MLHIVEKLKVIGTLILQGRLHPLVRETVAGILTQRYGTWVVPEGDYHGELLEIYNWIRHNIRYLPDPYNNDTIESAPYTLQVKACDCDGYVVLAGAMLASIGYEVALKIVGRQDEFDHIYLLVGVPPGLSLRFVPFDVSTDRWPGWEDETYSLVEIYNVF